MFITGLKYISRGSDYDFISTTPSQRYKLEQTKTRETARWLLGISDVTGCALHASCTTDSLPNSSSFQQFTWNSS